MNGKVFISRYSQCKDRPRFDELSIWFNLLSFVIRLNFETLVYLILNSIKKCFVDRTVLHILKLADRFQVEVISIKKLIEFFIIINFSMFWTRLFVILLIRRNSMSWRNFSLLTNTISQTSRYFLVLNRSLLSTIYVLFITI